MRARIPLAAAMMLVALPAFAAGTPAISLSPLVNFFAPVAAALITAALGLLIAVLKRYLSKLGINLADAQWAVVQRTASHWAAQWWASSETSLATKQIAVGNKEAAAWANLAILDIPAIAKALGLTPYKMEEFIRAEIGKLQANVVNVNVAAAAAKTESSGANPSKAVTR